MSKLHDFYPFKTIKVHCIYPFNFDNVLLVYPLNNDNYGYNGLNAAKINLRFYADFVFLTLRFCASHLDISLYQDDISKHAKGKEKQLSIFIFLFDVDPVKYLNNFKFCMY